MSARRGSTASCDDTMLSYDDFTDVGAITKLTAKLEASGLVDPATQFTIDTFRTRLHLAQLSNQRQLAALTERFVSTCCAVPTGSSLLVYDLLKTMIAASCCAQEAQGKVLRVLLHGIASGEVALTDEVHEAVRAVIRANPACVIHRE